MIPRVGLLAEILSASTNPVATPSSTPSPLSTAVSATVTLTSGTVLPDGTVIELVPPSSGIAGSIITGVVALIAAAVALTVGLLARKTGVEANENSSAAARASSKSANAATRSADAATGAVRVAKRSAKTAARSADAAERAAEASGRRAEQAALQGRYQDAAGLLSSSSLASRIAGVHQLAQLADEWPERRQACVDVLLSALRVRGRDVLAEIRANNDEMSIRRTIVSIMGRRLQDNHEPSWSSLEFDFTNALLSSANFQHARFLRRPRFDEAILCGTASFDNAYFEFGASFKRIKLLDDADLSFQSTEIRLGDIVIEDFELGDDADLKISYPQFRERGQILVGNATIKGRIYVGVQGPYDNKTHIVLRGLVLHGMVSIMRTRFDAQQYSEPAGGDPAINCEGWLLGEPSAQIQLSQSLWDQRKLAWRQVHLPQDTSIITVEDDDIWP